MANTRKPNRTLSWVNVKLSAEDKDYVKSNYPEPAELIEAMDSLVFEGGSFSIKQQDEHTAIAMVFRPATDDPTTTLACSAFAPELALALHVLLYKLLVKLDGQWTHDLASPPTNSGSIG